MDRTRVIRTFEQTQLKKEDTILLESANWKGKNSGIYMDKPYCLGLQKDGDLFWTSYYIGACSIKETSQQLIVLPKVTNIDFLKMFIDATNTEDAADYFAKCYDIEIFETPIQSDELYNLLTPILAVHYITILKKLINKGLLRGYIQVEDNLKSKIRGHISQLKNWRKNILNKREDRIYCIFQEYTNNIPVNRLLKKAFIHVVTMLNGLYSKSKNLNNNELISIENEIRESFSGIDDNVDIKEIRQQKFTKMNCEYFEAVKIAKMILKHYENNISENNNNQHYVQPFWIDMARLFELFVLKKLKDKYDKNIKFQVKGHRVCADYIHIAEKIVIDAKYKTLYLNDYDIDDIREVSGNARDKKITGYFIPNQGGNDENITCLIIYPDNDGITEFGQILLETNKIKEIDQFNKFYKIGIQLPIIK